MNLLEKIDIIFLFFVLNLYNLVKSETSTIEPPSTSDDNQVLKCPTSGKVLTLAMMNDGHCDCPEDGFDEPETAACKNGRFYCKHVGNNKTTTTSESIPSFMVNDGVCDCCDGSDEYLNNFNINCPNTCDEVERSRKREKLIRFIKLKKAAKGVDEMKSGSIKKRDEFEIKLIEIRTKIEELNKNLKEKEKDKPTTSSDPLAKQGALESLLVEYRQKIDELERLIADLTPTEESDGEEEEEEEEVNDSASTTEELSEEELESEPKPSTWKSGILKRVKDFVPNMVNSPYTTTITKYLPTIVTKTILQHEPERIYFEDQVKDFGYEVRELETQALEIEDDLKISDKYGPDSIFFSLKNVCFSKESGEFEYTLCWFRSVEQRSKSSVSKVSNNLGKWGRWEASSTSTDRSRNEYKVMVYEGGDRCGSKSRETHVHLECGWKNQILSVSEPSICFYVIQFSTPALCTLFEFGMKSK